MITITGVVFNQQGVTLYDKEGNSHRFPQGHAAIPYILNHIIPELGCNDSAEFLWEEPEPKNEFKGFEVKSKLVKFFSASRKDIAKWVSSKRNKVPALALASITSFLQKKATSVADKKFDTKKFHSATNSDLTQNNSIPHEEETIVAVVGDKIIPNAECLMNHLIHSNEYGNIKNVEAFLSLISEIIDDPSHSVEDLLRFIQLGDLPIADDGYIVGYKVLNKISKGLFADTYTGRVLQQVGDIVQTPVQMVDHDRRIECSNGLHFARRSYLRRFSGSSCVLVRVHPADFIAVPEGDASKCRVAKYHIIGEISSEGYSRLKSNNPLGQMDTELLTMALSGRVSAPKRIVTINGQRGADITVEVLEANGSKFEEAKAEPVSPTKDKSPIIPEVLTKTATVKVSVIENKIKEALISKKVATTSTRIKIQALIQSGITKESANEINLLRKKSKQSLLKLGVSANEAKRINILLK